jgi:hypothetical protein
MRGPADYYEIAVRSNYHRMATLSHHTLGS